MKALSIKEPSISRIAGGTETREMRTWRPRYRGDVLLVGSARPAGEYAGKAACVAELVNCIPMLCGEQDPRCQPPQYRPYAWEYRWVFENVRKVKPFLVKGRYRLYDVPDGMIEL